MKNNIRTIVTERAGGRCEYCHLHEDDDVFSFHIEHIIARKHGGTDELDNLALTCHQCNLHKGSNLSSIDPESKEIVNLFHPRNDPWSDHFRYSEDVVVGLTSIGRATIFCLCMNDLDRIRLRAFCPVERGFR